MNAAASVGAFQVGGALRVGALYVERPADRLLPSALAAGTPCVVLGPRQLGKSSLCLRAASALRDRGHRVALVDCTAIGAAGATPDGWLYALAEEMADGIGAPDPARWWDDHARVPPVRRFLGWLHGAVASQGRPLTLILDEVDVLKALPFGADEVLGALRSAFEARNHDTTWQRFAFCLLGVASPATLGSDPGRTPVNVALPIALADFAPEEARVLEAGLDRLGAPPRALLDEVLGWTGGHPWMTQRLCDALARAGPRRDAPAERVTALVEEMFLARGALSDVCLLASARQLLSDARLSIRLERYERALDRTAGAVRETDIELLLTGMVAERGGALAVRNRIFGAVFDSAWVAEHRGRRALAEAAEGWAARGHRDADVLRGSALEAAQDWARDRSDLSAAETALLLRSLEVARSEALMAQQMHAQVARLRLAAGALAVVVVALLVAGAALWGQTRAIRHQRALRTANEARLLAWVPKQQQAALRTAIAAVDLEARPETTLALVEALHAAGGVRVGPGTTPFRRVACDGDGARVAGESEDGIAVFDRAGRRLAASGWPDWPAVSPTVAFDVVFEPDGRLGLVSPGAPERILSGPLDEVYASAVSPDGRLLAAGGDDDRVWLWDVQTARLLGVFLQHTGTVRALAFCPDGRTVVSGSDDGTIGIWRAIGGLGETFVEGSRWVGASADGRLITAGIGGAWLGTDEPEPVLLADGDAQSAHVASDGSRAVVSVIDPAPRLSVVALDGGAPWTLDSWTVRWPGVISSDSRRFAAQSELGVGVWDLRTGDRLAWIEDLPTEPYSVTLSPDGTRAAVAGAAGATLFAVPGGARVAALEGHTETVPYAVFSPDGRWLATVSFDHTARLFDGRTGAAGPVLAGHRGKIPMGVFSPDGRRFATASYDATARVWDVESGAMLRELTGHLGLVRVVAFSPDGARVATGSDDGTVRLFDTETGETVAVLRAHRTAVRALAFLGDGDRLASAEDGLAVVQPIILDAWRLSAGQRSP